jgi:cobalamin biosynthesis Mg chelatase CobN
MELVYPPANCLEQSKLEGIMAKDKSILERFTDTVKDIANSASEALKAEEPPKVEQTNAAYMPFAAEGLVSDPLLVPPVAAQPPRKKHTARKTTKKSSARKATVKRAAAKKARKAAKTSARGKSKSASRSAARKSAKRTTRRATSGATAKRAAKRSRR